jgi:2-polyprenyl-3-methyl-5-hydroxy-6-metoxy-1,4-benzoquinol methylase
MKIIKPKPDNAMSRLYSDSGIFGNYKYAAPVVSRGMKVAMCLLSGAIFPVKEKSKILVIGAGPGYEVVYYRKHGHLVKAIDLYVPNIKMVKEVTTVGSATDIPFSDKEFDIVHCTEMMEHIEEDQTDAVLKECKRVADRFVFTIATTGDKPFNTHINIHNWQWWIDKFKEHNFTFSSIHDRKKVSFGLNHEEYFFKWHGGVFIYGEC